MILTAAAAAFLISCAPNVSSVTMAGLIEHESGWHQYAIGDNTARRSYMPTNYWDAVQIARSLRAQGHDIDAGLAQINDTNWRGYGLDEFSVFDPCRNVRVGGTILGRAYRGAIAVFPAPQEALVHALSAYNSGHFYASLGYANGVIRDAQNVRFLQTAPLTTPIVSLPPPVRIAHIHFAGPTLPVRTTVALAATPRVATLRTRASTPRVDPRRVLTWALPTRHSALDGAVLR